MKKPGQPNFLEQYLRHRGVSEVPKAYDLWSCLSLIAAVLGSNVWYEKMPGSKLYPNLYTILIGSSASGKGTAIDVAQAYALKVLPPDNVLRGKTTGANLSDRFCFMQKQMEEAGVVGAPQMYILFPELSMSIGEGPVAKDFIKRITEQFTMTDYEFKEGTRTAGNISYRAPLINLLMGSTAEWMFGSISRTDIRSGFFGRVIPVVGDYDPNVRIPRPWVPPEIEEIRAWLLVQLQKFAKLRGPFLLSSKAQDVRDTWYGDSQRGIPGRPAPSDPDLFPSWKRADDLALKIALILAVADGQRQIIQARHITDGIMLVEQAQRDIPKLIQSAGRREIMQDADALANMLQKNAVMTHSQVLKRMHDRGVRAPEVKEMLAGLIGQGKVEAVALKGGPGYQWLDDLTFAQMGAKFNGKEGEVHGSES